MVTAALVSDSLTQIGALGGILSIVGTGLLILLVASQSRQIRSMREWIEQEPQRQAETAQRVIAEVQRRIAAARERRAAPEGAPLVPPVGKLKPAPGTLGATPEAKKVAAAAASIAPPVVPGTPGVDAPKFAPLTPAGESSAPSMAPDPDEPAIVSEILNQETQAADALPDEDYDDVAAPAAASRPIDTRFSDEHFDLDEDEHPRSNRLLFGGGVAIVVIGVILLATQLFGGSKTPAKKATTDTSQSSGSSSKTPTPKAKTATAPARSTVPVLVFNATTINGLGQTTTNKLKAKGYQITGPPQSLSGNNSLTQSTVSYAPNYKSAANEVAKDLGLATTSVLPLDADTRTQAGVAAKVVVKTGSDMSNSSSSSTTG